VDLRYLREGYVFALGIVLGSLLGLVVAYMVLIRQGRDPVACMVQTLRHLLGKDQGVRLDLLLQ
jgi:ABC-type nitrate/sulfonate/bicarbonate transport system permease component